MISEEKGGPDIKANGLYQQMNHFNFFFGLKLGCLIFIDTEKVSRVLQSSSCCLQDVFCAAKTVIYHFQRIRGKKNFITVKIHVQFGEIVLFLQMIIVLHCSLSRREESYKLKLFVCLIACMSAGSKEHHVFHKT
jgi:hypothetical protein